MLPRCLTASFSRFAARLLQLAASLDRLDRAEGTVEGDVRLEKIREALAILASPDADRAEKIQLLFSRATTRSG